VGLLQWLKLVAFCAIVAQALGMARTCDPDRQRASIAGIAG